MGETPQVPRSRRRLSFLGHKKPHPLSWRVWPLTCPTLGTTLPRWTCPGHSAGPGKLVGMLDLAHIALSIWRNVQKNQRWASSENQSHRKGWVCRVQVRPGPVISRMGTASFTFHEDRLPGKGHLPLSPTVPHEGQNRGDAWGHQAFASPLPARAPTPATPEEGGRKNLEVSLRRDMA